MAAVEQPRMAAVAIPGRGRVTCCPSLKPLHTRRPAESDTGRWDRKSAVHGSSGSRSAGRAIHGFARPTSRHPTPRALQSTWLKMLLIATR